jgi:hypothetical protein
MSGYRRNVVVGSSGAGMWPVPEDALEQVEQALGSLGFEAQDEVVGLAGHFFGTWEHRGKAAWT